MNRSYFKRNKFNAVKTGDGFPSKLEAAVYQILLLKQKAGLIRDLWRQHSLHLIAGINWKVDFSYVNVETGEGEFAEAKGVETETYRLKLKLYRKFGTAKLLIYKGSYYKPYLHEIIKPEGML